MEEWFSADERRQLLEAGASGSADEVIIPRVRLFQADGPCVWLIGEIDPSDPDLAYGLVDLGVGAPEIGLFSLLDVATIRGALNLGVERDRAFVPRATLADLYRWASATGRIVR